MVQTDPKLAEELIRDLPAGRKVTKIEFLDKGYSTDRKYVLWAGTEPMYVLRVSDISEAERRRRDHDAVSRLGEMGIPCPAMIAFGTNEELGVCFIVQSYVAGECAEDALPTLPTDQQRRIGLDAGLTLRRIHHALPPPGPVDDFAIRSAKYGNWVAAVRELGIRVEGDDRAALYAESSMHLLRDRPTTFRHGDFHPGNLIVRDGKLAGVIDFNRCDWGDPVDDFYKVALFGAPLSEYYARGQITGYFDGDPPDDFWPLYNLYVAMVIPGDIAWTHKHWPQYLDKSIPLLESITRTHDFLAGGPPEWWKAQPRT